MRISYATALTTKPTYNGYGYATDRMLSSLARLGHTVNKNDHAAPVAVWFEEPQYWQPLERQYNIGYFPWESTLFKPGVLGHLNSVDEVWTPSPLVAKWFADAGVEVPIHVYEHGVDKVWSPKQRTATDKFRFLHLGAEAVRKGGRKTMQAFRLAFPGRDDVELTMKMVGDGWNITSFGRVKTIFDKLSLSDLINMFHEHHAYVYPSQGEGFGLTPLQAISTGMPVITVPDWAPYNRFLDSRLNLPARLVDSPWQSKHPGQVFDIEVDDIVDRMRWVVDNYDDAQATMLNQTDELQAAYDWDTLTSEAFSALERRLFS